MATKNWIAASIAMAIGLGSSGCSAKADAVERFGSSFDCPKDRIEVRERADLKGSQLESHAPPPPEVASDPGRYAVWKKKQDEQNAMEDNGGNYSVSIYEVRGCGHQTLYSCLSKPKCSKKDYPPGISKW